MVVALVLPSHPAFEEGTQKGIAPALVYQETFINVGECNHWLSQVQQKVESLGGDFHIATSRCMEYKIPEKV